MKCYPALLPIIFASRLLAAESELPLWLDIDWKLGPDLPQAFQDSDGGIIDDFLVTTCGYCDSRESAPASKKEKSGLGQHKKTWGLRLNGSTNGWQALPDYPGAARQELCAIAIGRRLFTWGGFSYNHPFCFRDGYLLSRESGEWRWQPLPELPWRLSSASISAIEDTIYIF